MRDKPVKYIDDLTFDDVRSLFHYDPETGIFARRARLGNRRTGALRKDGGTQIEIRRRKYLRHRLIWLYMTGRWPSQEIDHRDLDRSNDKWENLREASPSQNGCNKRGLRYSRSGIKGVFWHKQTQKWRAVIYFEKRQFHLGGFDDVDLAAAAYANAVKKYHGEFARVN